jgi:hypothetical protein
LNIFNSKNQTKVVPVCPVGLFVQQEIKKEPITLPLALWIDALCVEADTLELAHFHFIHLVVGISSNLNQTSCKFLGVSRGTLYTVPAHQEGYVPLSLLQGSNEQINPVCI